MNTERIKTLQMQMRTSMIITSLGLLMLIYMIIVEDEPGAIPLLLIVTGTGWYFITKSGIKPLNNQENED